MTAFFDSWDAFLAMGGYAFYVWLAVGITFISLLGICVHTRWTHSQLLADIRRQEARAQRVQKIKQQKASDHVVSHKENQE
ncbi:MAG: heme exporter protein CcmD [Plesiomonas shigelloides]